MRTVTVALVACVLTVAIAAQQPTFKRTVLQQSDISTAGH